MNSSLRVVSLLPSATEIICALGAKDNLLGISHECDFPENIQDRVVLTQARISPAGTSQEIDTVVRSVIEKALSIYSIQEEKLAKLAPTVIVTQDLCEVCAVSIDDVHRAVAKLNAHDEISIISLHPKKLQDVFENIGQVASVLQKVEEGKLLCYRLKERIDSIAQRAKESGKSLAKKPRVASIEWLSPIMLGGTWMPELIELGGGEAVGISPGSLAKTISPQKLATLLPDVLLIKPCGFILEQTQKEMVLIKETILSYLDKKTKVYLTDGNAFFNRPGPRLVESLEIMAACIHPEVFSEFLTKHQSVIFPL